MIENEHHIIEQDKLKTKIYLLLLPWNMAFIASIFFGYAFFRDYGEYKHYGYAPNADPVPHTTTFSDVCFYGTAAATAIIAALLIIALWIKSIRKTDRKARTAISLITVFLSEIAGIAIVFLCKILH